MWAYGPFYAHTRFGEDILIGAGDCFQKGIRRTPPPPSAQFYLGVCHRAKFKRNQAVGGRVIAILLFSHLGSILRQKSGKQFSELGYLPLHDWYREVWPPLVLDKFFGFPKKSSSSK